jgi:hypothetical protein
VKLTARTDTRAISAGGQVPRTSLRLYRRRRRALRLVVRPCHVRPFSPSSLSPILTPCLLHQHLHIPPLSRPARRPRLRRIHRLRARAQAQGGHEERGVRARERDGDGCGRVPGGVDPGGPPPQDEERPGKEGGRGDEWGRGDERGRERSREEAEEVRS